MKQVKLVIDANVFISYAMYGRLSKLVEVIFEYDLIVYVNGTLLKEIYVALSDKKLLKDDSHSVSEILDIIRGITRTIVTNSNFQLSPDVSDNFIFDLAIQSQSDYIITSEKRLLRFSESPVPIRNIKWFKENFTI